MTNLKQLCVADNCFEVDSGASIPLYDAPLDSNGDARTGGAITPTGLVNALYSTKGGVNITGALKDGETTTTRSDNIVIGRGNTAADSVNNIMIGFGHQAPSGGTSGHSAVMVGVDISSGVASVGAGAVATANGVLSIGHAVGDTRSSGGTFRNALRRRIVNVANARDANDAVTKGQLDAAIAALQEQIDTLKS